MRLSIFLALILFSTSAFAQNPTGCIIVFPYGAVSTYPGVYPTPLGINVPSGQNADVVGKPAYSSAGGIPVSYSCYKNPNPTTTRECAVRVTNANSTISWFGGVFAEKYYQCPIDDSSMALMFSVSILGFVLIRRKTVLN